MTFFAYLKGARERCGITQAGLAEKTGVSITTIQNWEKDTLPEKNSWSVIIEQLGLSKQEFMEYYANAVFPCSEEESLSPFPDFLFPDEKIERIKKMRLTADEQELLGLEELYGVEYDMYGDYKFKVTKSNHLPALPYEYVRRAGAFRIMNLNDSLNKKIGAYRDYVISQIKKKPEETFDIFKCSVEQLLDLCDKIEIILERKKSSYYGYNDNCTYNWGSKIRNILSCLKNIEGAGNSLVIARTNEKQNDSSWSRNDDWIKCDDYNSYIDSEQFIKIVETESQDPGYIEVKEKYEKDKLFYEDHASMMDHAPVPPKYLSTKNAEMTERGKQLWNWYKNNH